MRKEVFKELVTRVAEQMPEAKNVQVFGYEIFVKFNNYVRTIEYCQPGDQFCPVGRTGKSVVDVDPIVASLTNELIRRIDIAIHEYYKRDPYFPG